MARGKAKGKDAASMAGKCTLGTASVTMLIGLIAIIMAATTIVLSNNDEKLKKCSEDKKAFPNGCGRRALSTAGSSQTTHMDKWNGEFLAAMGMSRRDLSSASVSVALMFSGCSGDICSIKTDGDEKNVAQNSVNCAKGDSCTTSLNKYQTCGDAKEDTDCFEKVSKTAVGRESNDKDCCATACGSFNTLVEAECSAKAGVFTEKCTCKMIMSPDKDKNVCEETKHEYYKTKEYKDKSGKKVGETMCKWSKDSTYAGSSGLWGTSSGPTCGFTKERVCEPKADENVVNAIASIRQLAIVAGLMATFGVLPAIIGAVAKLKGNEQLETMCGMISAFSTLCCGFVVAAGISAYLFVGGALISAFCTSAKEEFDKYKDDETICTETCKAALEGEMDVFCKLGSGLSSTSIVCILASLCGLLTAIYACMGFCNRRKQVQQTVIVQQQVVPAAQATVVVDEKPQVA